MLLQLQTLQPAKGNFQALRREGDNAEQQKGTTITCPRCGNLCNIK